MSARAERGRRLLRAIERRFRAGFGATNPWYHLGALAFSHVGQRLGECKQRSPAELARLPANMRAETVCPRERAPVRIRVEIDDQVFIDEIHAARGIARDGAVLVYRRLPIAAGRHRIRVRVADGANAEEFRFVRDESVDLAPGKLLTLDFDRDGIRFR